MIVLTAITYCNIKEGLLNVPQAINLGGFNSTKLENGAFAKVGDVINMADSHLF